MLDGVHEEDSSGDTFSGCDDVENVPGDEGEVVVRILEKILLAPRQSMTSQRNVIFKTRCTINGRVCELLIDSRCTENVIFRAVVKVLNLKTTKHPQPYKISWVRRGSKIVVSEMCRVAFSIDTSYVNMKLCVMSLTWMCAI